MVFKMLHFRAPWPLTSFTNAPPAPQMSTSPYAAISSPQLIHSSSAFNVFEPKEAIAVYFSGCPTMPSASIGRRSINLFELASSSSSSLKEGCRLGLYKPQVESIVHTDLPVNTEIMAGLTQVVVTRRSNVKQSNEGRARPRVFPLDPADSFTFDCLAFLWKHQVPDSAYSNTNYSSINVNLVNRPSKKKPARSQRAVVLATCRVRPPVVGVEAHGGDVECPMSAIVESTMFRVPETVIGWYEPPAANPVLHLQIKASASLQSLYVFLWHVPRSAAAR
ncbi:hypothetical protein C8R43DRAFT_1127768 [Mycena crocata]|nr:hypothetical protein C8R43DRAFT_1127768 [Mycena crocata]